MKRSKVKGPAKEIQFLEIKWQDGCRQIPMDVINQIAAMSPPTNKKEAQAFLGVVGFWRIHIPNYSQIVSPLYHVTHKKNDFEWGPFLVRLQLATKASRDHPSPHRVAAENGKKQAETGGLG